MQALYECTVSDWVNRRSGQCVVDVGGGRKCDFARRCDPKLGTRLIAVDVSPEELSRNTDVDEKRVADATVRLPFEDSEVDILTSRSVIEHVRGVEGFVAEAQRVLKSEGLFINVFPSKFAPFAIVNQLLPNALTAKLLGFIRPESEGILGFVAYYENCYPSAMQRLLTRHGFEIVELRVGYYQSAYFSFFVPFFLLSAAYEVIVQSLSAKNLAANCLIVARKRDPSEPAA